MILEAVSTFHLLSILLGLLLLALYVLKKDKHVNLPPGPRGVPFFGNLLTLAKAPRVSSVLMEMAKEHGQIMTVKLGPRIAVVLTGYDTVKEALVDKAEYFSSRPMLKSAKDNKRENGIIETSQWKERRRLALTSMRDFGLGKKSLDERMIEEAEILLKELESFGEESVSFHTLVPVVTTNIICSIIRGERFSYDNEKILRIVSAMKNMTKVNQFTRTGNYSCWLPYVPFVNIPKWEGDQEFQWILKILQGWINDHKETFHEGTIRDLIDLFISESRKESNCKEENILPMIWDLFAAGTETTSTTLLWSIAYLIVHKDIQTKCRNEIHEIVGHSKLPAFADMKKLPYLNSVMNEVQRMANIIPLSLFHATSEKVELQGHTIPKGTMVIVNLESALKDEKYWGDPYTFRPERWLDEDGQLARNKAFIPFSTGKRICLGEHLAKKELFIFLSSMLQNFEFEVADGTKPPNLNKEEAGIRSAPAYKVKIKKL